MHLSHHEPPCPDDPVSRLWQRGLRLATRLAIGLGLATVAAIVLGAAMTDNGFVQIVVTLFAALAFWLPLTVMVYWVERLFERRRSPPRAKDSPRIGAGGADEEIWRRLLAAAPAQSQRIAAIRASLGRSRAQLGEAKLDPDAIELCVLIDRRLPELIRRGLDDLPPDDRNRQRELGELVGLVEQFARHCTRGRVEGSGTAGYDAEVLRRRFEARLSEF